MRTHWETYEQGAAKAGRVPDRRNWRVCMDIHMAETTEEARNDVLNCGMAQSFDEFILPLFRRLGITALMKLDESTPDEAITAEYLMDHRWAVGDPDHCLRKIREAYDELGGFGTLILMVQCWDPPEKGWKSLELFMKYAAPELQELWPNTS